MIFVWCSFVLIGLVVFAVVGVAISCHLRALKSDDWSPWSDRSRSYFLVAVGILPLILTLALMGSVVLLC